MSALLFLIVEAPSCRRCGGLLKPAVVFFGENVPMKTVRIADALIKKCDSMLVIGSSLYVSARIKY